jgi:hypothetical protein
MRNNKLLVLPILFILGIFTIQASVAIAFRALSRYLGEGPLAHSIQAPEPRLQINEPQDLKAYRDQQNQILESYAWIDHKNGRVRIPVEKAMESMR